MSFWLRGRLLHGRIQGGSGEKFAPREVEAHARWKPERRRDKDRGGSLIEEETKTEP